MSRLLALAAVLLIIGALVACCDHPAESTATRGLDRNPLVDLFDPLNPIGLANPYSPLSLNPL